MSIASTTVINRFAGLNTVAAEQCDMWFLKIDLKKFSHTIEYCCPLAFFTEYINLITY